jgi:hypothetical protein
MQSSEKLSYFLAGALLPALAYILLGLTKGKCPSNDTADSTLYDDDSDDDLQEQLGNPSSKDPREWGLRDCPYKVKQGISFLNVNIPCSCNRLKNIPKFSLTPQYTYNHTMVPRRE